jgi:opacity protein-like surface antigen
VIRRLVIACAALALTPAAASAQPPGRLAVVVGGGWTGAASLGIQTATLTANDGSPYTLFTTDTTLGAEPFTAVSIGVGLVRMLDVEMRGSYGRPDLVARTAGDAEGADAVAATEAVREFTLAAVARIHPAAWRLGMRAALFASGGAGYLRHLHEDDGYAVGGRVYLAGGGLTYRLGGGSGRVKDAGLRFDGGVIVRAGPAALDRARAAPLAAAALYLHF